MKKRKLNLELGYGWQNKGIETSRYLKAVESIVSSNINKKVCLLFHTNTLFGAKISKFTETIQELCQKQNISYSTTHSFKGRESDVIVVVDADGGNYPKIHPDNELMEILGVTPSNVIEEERRLFYVAITRAKEKLYLLYDSSNGHSDFISEIEKNGWRY